MIAFLDWTAEKGMIKRGTARSLRSACNAVLSVMDDDEARDVSGVDLQAVIQRYQNLHSLDVSPKTMQAYDRRVRQAVEEFVRFNQDKAGWKPSGVRRSRTPARSNSMPKNSSGSTNHAGVKEPPSPTVDFDVSEIIHQFPLRRDKVVTVTGIPFDVKRSEMSRLNAFLSNLVVTPEEEQQQLMLTAPASEIRD